MYGRFSESRQVQIWQLRRLGKNPSDIALECEVSPPTVSQALRRSTETVDQLLLEAVRSNRLSINRIDAKMGFVWAYSPTFKVDVFVTFSPEAGVQVWYDHEGDCSSCESFEECESLLILEAEERKIVIQDDVADLSPSSLAQILFSKIMEDLGWK